MVLFIGLFITPDGHILMVNMAKTGGQLAPDGFAENNFSLKILNT